MNIKIASGRYLLAKSTALAFLAILAAVMVLAQGGINTTHFPLYDPKKPPPVTLPEAFKLATAHLGSATNRFHCVTASCLEGTNELISGWTFGFSNTKGDIARIKVFFNKMILTDANSAELLKK